MQSKKLINLQQNMSIYSGFATRNLQQTYDQYICDLLFVLQKRILKFYENAEADEDKFWHIFSQLYQQIVHLEKCKYLDPKSSIFVTEMFEYLKAKKHEREQDPEQDLKQFQRSMAIKKTNQDHEIQIKETQVNNFIRRSSFSFGKIKRQLQSGKPINVNSSTKNQGDSFNTSFDNKNQGKLANPQEKRQFRQKRIFSSKGIRNAKSFHQEDIGQNFQQAKKLKAFNGHPAEEIVKQYLEKTNKNYLRGYRKRKIKQEFGISGAKPQISKHFARDKSSER